MPVSALLRIHSLRLAHPCKGLIHNAVSLQLASGISATMPSHTCHVWAPAFTHAITLSWVRHRRTTPIYLCWLRLHSLLYGIITLSWVRHRRTTPIYPSWLRLHSRYPAGTANHSRYPNIPGYSTSQGIVLTESAPPSLTLIIYYLLGNLKRNKHSIVAPVGCIPFVLSLEFQAVIGVVSHNRIVCSGSLAAFALSFTQVNYIIILLGN